MPSDDPRVDIGLSAACAKHQCRDCKRTRGEPSACTCSCHIRPPRRTLSEIADLLREIATDLDGHIYYKSVPYSGGLKR